VGDSSLGDVRSSGKGSQATWGGDDRRPPVPSALRAVSAATRNRVGHGTGRSNGNGPLTCGPDPLNDFQISTLHSNL
jgi:hypothetical protein